MKALSVRQPYAGLIKAGYKNAEIRSWNTHHRGETVIHASAGPEKNMHKFVGDDYSLKIMRMFAAGKISGNELGCTLCTAMITDCIPFEEAQHLNSFVSINVLKLNFPEKKFYAWILEHIRPIKPVTIKGKLSLWDIDDSLIKYL